MEDKETEKQSEEFTAHGFTVVPYLLFGLGFAFIVGAVNPNNIEGSIPVMLFGLIPIAIGFINYVTTKITVDKNGVHFKRGLINTQTKEYSFNNIESISIDQSLVARIFGFGTVKIYGSGNSKSAFQSIEDPNRLKEVIYEFKK
jgi:uncharacterized membrane protein YdbT with pleckstrin-like domain